jgi:CPA2 family monovalent cation:H+ antiporter-2
MGEHVTAPVVLDVGFVLLLAAAAGWTARRIGIPSVVGYLVVGLAVSPFTPGYVADRGQIAILADIGVVLLLFEVGIEVDVARITRESRSLLLVAPLQIALGTVVGAIALSWLGIGTLGAALLGLSLAMSSSVVVVNITRSRRRTTDPATERALLGWSVLQDITGVALAALVLALFGGEDRPVAVALGGLGAYAIVAAGAAAILPHVLRRLRAEHDLFLVVSVATGLTLAAAGAVIFGVPMALAAFVAGLGISEGAETAEARRRLLPFRDLFAVFFFVAVGSLIDPVLVPASLPFVGAFLVLVVVLKVGVVYVFARIAHLPARPAQLAVGLGQVGEFGYVLGAIGVASGALSNEHFAALLVVVVLTIAGSAILARRVGGGGGPMPVPVAPEA